MTLTLQGMSADSITVLVVSLNGLLIHTRTRTVPATCTHYNTLSLVLYSA